MTHSGTSPIARTEWLGIQTSIVLARARATTLVGNRLPVTQHKTPMAILSLHTTNLSSLGNGPWIDFNDLLPPGLQDLTPTLNYSTSWIESPQVVSTETKDTWLCFCFDFCSVFSLFYSRMWAEKLSLRLWSLVRNSLAARTRQEHETMDGEVSVIHNFHSRLYRPLL